MPGPALTEGTLCGLALRLSPSESLLGPSVPESLSLGNGLSLGEGLSGCHGNVLALLTFQNQK